MMIANRTFPVSPSSFIYPPLSLGIPVVVVYVLKLSLLEAFRVQLPAIDLKMFDQSLANIQHSWLSHRLCIYKAVCTNNDVICKRSFYKQTCIHTTRFYIDR